MFSYLNLNSLAFIGFQCDVSVDYVRRCKNKCASQFLQNAVLELSLQLTTPFKPFYHNKTNKNTTKNWSFTIACLEETWTGIETKYPKEDDEEKEKRKKKKSKRKKQAKGESGDDSDSDNSDVEDNTSSKDEL